MRSNSTRPCLKIADDFTANSADNEVTIFRAGARPERRTAAITMGTLMKALKLIGLAIGASLALSTA
ncbi:MAG: hypothetical protein ACM3OF_05985, partial [Gemmatimonas sp.]